MSFAQLGGGQNTDTARLYGAVRWVVWLIWLAVGLDEIIKFALKRADFLGTPALPWLATYLAFAAALWLNDVFERARSHSRLRSVATLAFAEICIATLLYLQPNSDADSFFLVLAWQAGLILPRRWAIAWVFVQTALFVLVLRATSPAQFVGIGLVAIYWSQQAFALVTALVARREARISLELEHNNAVLKATQLKLAQAGQIGERVRIARELHDSLGHDLTALGLHLEAALHTSGHPSEDLKKARAIARGLLCRLRDVVRLMRSDESTNLASVLRSLVSDSPGLKIHLEIADDIDVIDAERAHALMRCIQEFITNARRHSGAANLWLRIKRDGGRVVASARDDGRGATPQMMREGRKSGEGLRGARERLAQFGGELIVDTALDKGFALEITLPLGANP